MELASYFSPIPSFVLVYVVLPLTAGLSFARNVARAREQRRLAEHTARAAQDEVTTLDAGDTILHGEVAYARDRERALETTIEQEGHETENSGTYTVWWEETRRTVEVEPFYVVHASGTRVRVEPGAGVKLATILSTATRVDTTHRRRVARLRERDTVWVTGVLGKEHDPEAGGYRENSSWVMRPSRSEPMLVSTIAPEKRFAQNAAHARTFAWVFGILFALAMIAHIRYHALVFAGQPTVATLTDMREDSNDYCLVDATVGGRRETWNVELPFGCNREHMPATTEAFATSVTAIPGRAPETHIALAIVPLIAWFLLWIVARVMRPGRDWFDGERVKDSESGRLEENAYPLRRDRQFTVVNGEPFGSPSARSWTANNSRGAMATLRPSRRPRKNRAARFGSTSRDRPRTWCRWSRSGTTR